MVNKKNILNLSLALIVIIGMFTLKKASSDIIYNTAQGGEGTHQRCTPDKIIKAAKGEVGKQYRNDITPYGNNGQYWCAYFAVWVYEKAGCNIKREGNSRKLLEWFASAQPPVMTNPYDARGGDIIVWKYKTRPSGHTGVVINNDTARKVIWTVEGNSNQQDKVMIRKFDYKTITNRDSMNFKVYGFGRV